jgi:thiol-disulfide isomerase/thioredoxin
VGFGWVRAPSLPTEAPAFTLADLHGQRVSLADFRGHTVVLNFWATWCGPCRMEIPTLSAFAAAHPDIPILGIAVDGTAAQLEKAAASFGITYPVLVADKATLSAYGIGTLPTSVIVGPDGKVRSAHTGLMLRPHLWWLTR